jgi:hypothetical protein
VAVDVEPLFAAEARERQEATRISNERQRDEKGRVTGVAKNGKAGEPTPTTQPAAPDPPEKEKPAPVHARAQAAKVRG